MTVFFPPYSRVDMTTGFLKVGNVSFIFLHLLMMLTKHFRKEQNIFKNGRKEIR